MLAGFREATEDDLSAGAELNLQRYRNEVSPFAELPRSSVPNDPLYVDTHYGLVYDGVFLDSKALYGPTDALPSYGADALADLGFLRVPFRRLPRIRMRHQADLDRFVGMIRSEDPKLKTLYRGQSREYRVPRDAQTLNWLYGDPEAIEPSIPSSASRAGIELEAILPEWYWILRAFLLGEVDNARSWASEATLQAIREDYHQLTGGFRFHHFALALAQHYGLPSAGVDVTPDPRIAAFFALHAFVREIDGSRMLKGVRKTRGDEPGVIYVFGVGQRFSLDYEQFRPRTFPVGRPDRQRAFFLHTGWGLSRNECARRVWVALYLDPDGDFDMPSCAEMFPEAGADRFARFLLDIAPEMTPRLRDYLSRLYWVAS